MNSWFRRNLKIKLLASAIALLLILAIFYLFYKNQISNFISQLSTPKPNLIQEFGGSYYMGDGLGLNCNFEINSDATFNIRWVSDVGSRADFEGSISYEDERFVLTPINKVEKPMPCFHRTFIPINWGSRKYLLPDDNDKVSKFIVSAFCENVKNGVEPRNGVHGLAYLRKTDVTITATGFPSQLNGQLQCP